MLTQAVVREVLLACNNAAAKQTLSRLWEEARAVQGPSKRPGDDAVLVANLIELIVGLVPAPCLVRDGH